MLARTVARRKRLGRPGQNGPTPRQHLEPGSPGRMNLYHGLRARSSNPRSVGVAADVNRETAGDPFFFEKVWCRRRGVGTLPSTRKRPLLRFNPKGVRRKKRPRDWVRSQGYLCHSLAIREEEEWVEVPSRAASHSIVILVYPARVHGLNSKLIATCIILRETGSGFGSSPIPSESLVLSDTLKDGWHGQAATKWLCHAWPCFPVGGAHGQTVSPMPPAAWWLAGSARPGPDSLTHAGAGATVSP